MHYVCVCERITLMNTLSPLLVYLFLSLPQINVNKKKVSELTSLLYVLIYQHVPNQKTNIRIKMEFKQKI